MTLQQGLEGLAAREAQVDSGVTFGPRPGSNPDGSLNDEELLQLANEIFGGAK